MKISTLFASFFVGVAIAAPTMDAEKRVEACTNPIKRKEFRNMNVIEKGPLSTPFAPSSSNLPNPHQPATS